MITYIYEHLSHKLHHYQNPTAHNNHGFNHTNYTLADYIVFFPDITYTFNDPGISALRCVEAGVKAVLAKGIVDKDRIGLIGHSFGGYETAFIVTQSNLFATAVVGAGVMDLVSWYHAIDHLRSIGRKSRMFRFEDWQFRIKDAFYKNPAAYYRNSPLHHISTIKTPLLIWTGEEDKNIGGINQTMELFTGLRRLGKPAELLIYPGEGHTLSQTKNQTDLTRRIKDWFDSYLKPNIKKMD